MNDTLRLIWLNLVVKKRNFIEYLRVIFKYYRNLSFMKDDLFLLSKYLFKNPFAISKEFLMKKGEENVYAYGETPLTTMDIIAQKAKIGPSDVVYELGCGRGRTCIWLSAFRGCKVIGIDYVPAFVEKGNQLNKERVIFRLQDILEADFVGATVIYLYGTCYESSFIKKLISKFKKLPTGVRIITVSYALNEYTDERLFDMVQRFSCTYTWGQADVYVQIKL